MTKTQKRLWIGLIVLAFLSPLGIVLPEKFKAHDAWGEWSTDSLQKVLGYVPEGLKKHSELWKAPIPDYSFESETAVAGRRIISYAFSGFIGIAMAGLVIHFIVKFLVRDEKRNP